MSNRRPRRSRQRTTLGDQTQVLLHPMTTLSSGVAVTNIAQPASGIIANRPARPDYVTVEYFSLVPHTFNFTIFGGNAEEVYRSPAYLSGPIPKRVQVSLPKNTDFAIYPANGNVIQFNHALGPNISFVVNMRVAYKTALPVAAF